MAKKILMIVGDYVEDYELMVPFQALQMVGHIVHVVCPDKDEGDNVVTTIHDFEECGQTQTYSEKRGHNFTLNESIWDVDVNDYDALIIPGGRSPEYIRLHSEVIDIVKEFNEAGKPIAAIGHGPLVLAAAGILKGRECSGYKAISYDIINAGGEWIDLALDEAHVDDNLVTASAWSAHPAWLSALLGLLKTNIDT
jgi:protease I